MPVRQFVMQSGKTLLDLGVLTAGFGLAFVLRFDGSLPAAMLDTLLWTLPFVLLVKWGCLGASGVLRSAWRHISLHEAQRIFVCLTMASGLLAAWRLAADHIYQLVPFLRQEPIPLGVILFDLVLGFLGITGLRVSYRLIQECLDRQRRSSQQPLTPTLLIGAGHAGALVAREIASRANLGIQPLGFLDDNPNLQGMSIHGIPVLGTTAQLGEVVERSGARQALITIANGSGSTIRHIARLCESCGIATKIIPPLHEIVGGKLSLSKIRDVDIEDLLRRPPVSLDGKNIAGIVSGRVILVTGAGGSIGSELCRQVCRFAPATLILVEQAENSLFHIHRELVQAYPALEIVPCIADICDSARLEQLFSSTRPDVVFHAAAHKHVPMMEWNPGEAVKNNVNGTATLARMAHAYQVDQFVMISTDKAVNPSSVMGVSKRVAELFVQAFSLRSRTRFVTVRFGNVLGSNGSVIPIFKEQIAKGGPITVTHPDMTRYFMTILEACQLVLQAASMGKGGEIFILDMGEPVKIVDLARDLIRLSGLVPDQDVEIRFTGVRPGEKLTEELFMEEESAAKTYHPRIFIGQHRPAEWRMISDHVEELVEVGDCGDARIIHAKFKEIVPEYTPDTVPEPAAPRVRVDAPHGTGMAPALGKNFGPELAAPMNESA